MGWGEKQRRPLGRGRNPGAVARAPFRETWRVGAVALPRRPSVGRRLWSLTKEKPQPRQRLRAGGGEQSPGGWSVWKSPQLVPGGGRLRCCDWISWRRPAHLGVEGFGGSSASPSSGEVQNLTHAPFVLTQDIPKFLRFLFFYFCLPPPNLHKHRVLLDKIE